MDRLFSFVLHGAELAFAAIVAGVTGEYLAHAAIDEGHHGRTIYTEVIAGVSILAALVMLIPTRHSFYHWPFQLLLSIGWFVAFGLLVNWIGNSCGYVFDWGNVSPAGDQCGKFKADMAFCFLSAILWLASALLAMFWIRSHDGVSRGFGFRSRGDVV